MDTSASLSPDYTAGHWSIDPAHSNVGFVVKHMMVSRVAGWFTAFEGSITTAADIKASSVEVVIDASSVNTHSDTRDDDIRSEHFLDVDRYPHLRFQSHRIVQPGGANFEIHGDLTIRGITREVILIAEAPAFAVFGSSTGATKMGVSARTRINRRDFNVNYSGALPGGGVSVSQAVDILIEVEATLL